MSNENALNPVSEKDFFRKSIEKANRESRARELERELEPNKIIEEMNELNAKLAENKLKAVPDRKQYNKTKFAQLLQENVQYLRKVNYLTSGEKSFLFDVMPNVSIGSNCIVDDIRSKKHATPLSITQISEMLDKNKSTVSRLVSSLHKKGILYKGDTGTDGNNATSNSIFINPNIIYAGDRNNVQEHLCFMFKKVPKQMQQLPVNLIPKSK